MAVYLGENKVGVTMGSSGGGSIPSHTHGNITNDGELQTTDITIANGDKLIVTDSSNSSKVARTSLAFDGSTTDQFLSKKGTWEFADGGFFPSAALQSAFSEIENLEWGYFSEDTQDYISAIASGDYTDLDSLFIAYAYMCRDIAGVLSNPI